MDFGQIITDEDFDNLPDDPGRRFTKIEAICRNNMYSMIGDGGSEEYVMSIRKKYIDAVQTVAEELGIAGVSYEGSPFGLRPSIADYVSFEERVKTVCIRLRLRGVASREGSVRLAEKTRGKIEQQIAILRIMVNDEVTPQSRKTSLLRRLDELSVELSQPRVRFSIVMGVLAAVAACTTVSADGPKAVHNITQMIGMDKHAEDEEISRLGAPPTLKALPAPSSGDELPF